MTQVPASCRIFLHKLHNLRAKYGRCGWLEYTFDMSRGISEEDLRRLRRRLAELAQDEGLRIRVDSTDSPQAGSLINLLTSNGYTYQPYKSEGDDEQYLIVRRLH